MKKYLFIFVCIISSISILAQPGCPSVTVASPAVNLPCGTTCTTLSSTYFNVGSTATYDVTQIPYNPPVPFWTGTPVLIGIDDQYSNAIQMPFNFCFFGQTYNQFIIGSNGVVSFDLSNAGSTNSWQINGTVPANTPSDCDASIMGVWEDIDPTNLGSTSYQVIGSYPCRTFIISFDSVPYFGDPNSVSAGSATSTPTWASSEIVLYETTNVIEIYIREKQIVTGWNGGLAVEGIVNPSSGGLFGTPTIAYTVPGRNATQWTANNDAWRFTPTSSSIVTVNWSHAGTVLSTSTGDTAIGPQTLTYSVCPPSSTTVPITTGYTVTAIYNRCDGTTVIESDSINVTTTPSPNGGPDQNLGCYASGMTATMAGLAFPGASWSALPGNPSATTIASPSSPTSTITGFGTIGTYTYLWGSGTCFDTVRLRITSGPTAEPTQFVTCVPLPGGSVTMGASGTGSWAALPGNPGTAVITTPTNPTTTITTFSALGTYHFLWNNGTACTDSGTVIVSNAPFINFTVQNIGCTNTTGSITANASGGVSPFTYQWSTGSTTDSVMTTATGTLYTVTVTDANQCSATATDSISNLTGTIVIADSILNGCYGFNDGQITLYMVPGGAYTYTWSTGGNTNPLTGLAAGNNYQVTVTNVASGCTAVGGPYTITTLGLDSVSITPLDTTVSLGDTIQLGSNVMGIYPPTSYSWTPLTGLSCSNCPDPILIPTIADTARTTYQLTITYGSGCIATGIDSIRAISINLLGVPDAFSPNGDTKNNTFYIMATDVKDFRLAIYNRWGGEVFETNDINTGWDGTYKGNPEPSEVYNYFFSITYTNDKVVAREGTVTLFR